MLKILLEKWEKNHHLLQRELEEGEGFNTCCYLDLVKLTFDTIYNDGEDRCLNTKAITEIDNGEYQGTLLFLIPFDTYQPSEHEYLMTYVGYGSCSGCDTLLGIQGWKHEKLTPEQVILFMDLCRDIIVNTIKPYNNGWREDTRFSTVVVGE